VCIKEREGGREPKRERKRERDAHIHTKSNSNASCLSFAEYHLFYRALSQKRRIILRRLLTEATLTHVNEAGESHMRMSLVRRESVTQSRV